MNKKIFVFSILFSLFFVSLVFADEISIGYQFEDSSIDEWTSVDPIAIDSNYSLVIFDLETFTETKSSVYNTIGVDLSDIAIDDLYCAEGTLYDIGIEKIYLFGTTNAEYSALCVSDFSETYTVNSQNITITCDSEGKLSFSGGSAGAIYNEPGELVGIAISETEGYSASFLLDALSDYIATEDAETENTNVSESTSTALNFSSLESVIAEAQQIDATQYSNTTDFDSAFTNAKAVYLTATTQDEIDEATTELQSAIDALTLSEIDFEQLEQFAILAVIVIFILILLLYFFVARKRKAKENAPKKNTQKPKEHTQDYSANYYESNYGWEDNNGEEEATSMLRENHEAYSGAYLIRNSTNEKIPIRGSNFSIGRSNADYRVINNPTVGRIHCYIKLRGNDYYISDNSSLNGTFVNGDKINDEFRLEANDDIRLSDEEFTFYLD